MPERTKNFAAWTVQVPCPPWLPVYEIGPFIRKVDRDYPFGAEQGVTPYFNARLLQEQQALIEICRSFDAMHLARRYRPDPDWTEARIDALLRQNEADGEPTYTGLLRLMVEAGILVPES